MIDSKKTVLTVIAFILIGFMTVGIISGISRTVAAAQEGQSFLPIILRNKPFTHTPRPSRTSTFTSTISFTQTQTPLVTASYTPIDTNTPTGTLVPTETDTPTGTSIPIPTETNTPANTSTSTSIPIPPTSTYTPTFTPIVTSTYTPTGTATATRTVTPTRTATPVISKTPTSTQSGNPITFNQLPYTVDSYWNVPIINPVYDLYSTEMIATIGSGVRSTTDQYNYPVYIVDNNTPTYNVPCSGVCKIINPDDTATRVYTIMNVPIPALAQPAAGTDAQVIIINIDTGTEYDFYHFSNTSGAFSTVNGSIYNVFRDGTPATYASRGAGVPYLAGLIRPWEIAQGHIDHALALVKRNPRSGKCVYPATKTDGSGTGTYDIPQGARLQLDPSLSDDYFRSIGLSPTGIIIAHALQKYGMILIDSGGVKIVVENLVNNPYATESWSDPSLNLTATSIANIPYTSFRVLKLPGAYWSNGTKTYGNCYGYP